MRRITLSVLTLAAGAFAQQVGQNAATPSTGNPTFQSSTQLVVETVTVTDKDGKPITGLTQKDFTVTEDNAPQTIKFFEFQQLPDPPKNDAEPAQPPPRVTPLAKLPRTVIATETPGDLKYRDRRLM